MTFYAGSSFPARYRGGAFVAFHGSGDRGGDDAGLLVAFVPFEEDADAGPEVVAGPYEVFATGFAAHRLAGIAVGPDGALYVSDDAKGRILKITYEGVDSGTRNRPDSSAFIPATRDSR
jgi:glucose/arabinose dehydrogenase